MPIEMKIDLAAAEIFRTVGEVMRKYELSVSMTDMALTQAAFQIKDMKAQEYASYMNGQNKAKKQELSQNKPEMKKEEKNG